MSAKAMDVLEMNGGIRDKLRPQFGPHNDPGFTLYSVINKRDPVRILQWREFPRGTGEQWQIDAMALKDLSGLDVATFKEKIAIA